MFVADPGHAQHPPPGVQVLMQYRDLATLTIWREREDADRHGFRTVIAKPGDTRVTSALAARAEG